MQGQKRSQHERRARGRCFSRGRYQSWDGGWVWQQTNQSSCGSWRTFRICEPCHAALRSLRTVHLFFLTSLSYLNKDHHPWGNRTMFPSPERSPRPLPRDGSCPCDTALSVALSHPSLSHSLCHLPLSSLECLSSANVLSFSEVAIF